MTPSRPRVLVFGTFDHLHPGHRDFLAQAQALGEVSVVVARAVNVLRIKGKAPADSEEARVAGVRAAVPGATVMLGDVDDFLAPVREIMPDLILLGYDQRLPPGVWDQDLPCPVRRAAAFRPEEFKSSIRRAD